MPSVPQRTHPIIVLVEEETVQREDIARHLHEAGYTILEAPDSPAAIALLEGRSDVQGLVTDAHVPGRMDGFELARLARERWPSLAVVLMSGHSDPLSEPVPDGSVFIAKPYLFEQLAPTLRGLIGQTDGP
jgi:CheY-like chemotaxis protein